MSVIISNTYVYTLTGLAGFAEAALSTVLLLLQTFVVVMNESFVFC
jgi:hypothetical protein